MQVADRLAGLGLVLPTPAAAIASYMPTARTGNLLFISGQLPLENGKLAAVGQLGRNVSIEQGQAGARLCALALLAQAQVALGSLDRIRRVIRLGGFVCATEDFTDHAKVMNGASDLMEAVFGEAGRHTRTTIGVASLPLGAAVEIEALLEVE